MLAALIIFLGLSPALCSLWLLRRGQTHAEVRLQRAINSVQARGLGQTATSEYDYVEGIGYIVGDLSCRFNARSRFLRCAVNPSEPCDACLFYEAVTLSRED